MTYKWWKEAIELTLEMSESGACGFCAMCGRDSSGIINCSLCPLNIKPKSEIIPGKLLEGCADTICKEYDIGNKEENFSGFSHFPGRKHFWREVSLSNPKLKIKIEVE